MKSRCNLDQLIHILKKNVGLPTNRSCMLVLPNLQRITENMKRVLIGILLESEPVVNSNFEY